MTARPIDGSKGAWIDFYIQNHQHSEALVELKYAEPELFEVLESHADLLIVEDVQVGGPAQSEPSPASLSQIEQARTRFKEQVSGDYQSLNIETQDPARQVLSSTLYNLAQLADPGVTQFAHSNEDGASKFMLSERALTRLAALSTIASEPAQEMLEAQMHAPKNVPLEVQASQLLKSLGGSGDIEKTWAPKALREHVVNASAISSPQQDFALSIDDAELLLANSALTALGYRLMDDTMSWNFAFRDELDEQDPAQISIDTNLVHDGREQGRESSALSDSEPNPVAEATTAAKASPEGEIYCRFPISWAKKMRGVRQWIAERPELSLEDPQALLKACEERLRNRGIEKTSLRLMSSAGTEPVLVLPVEQGLELLPAITGADVKAVYPEVPHEDIDLSSTKFNIHNSCLFGDLSNLIYESDEKVHEVIPKWFPGIQSSQILIAEGPADGRGMVAFDAQRNCIHVVFSGSDTLEDLMRFGAGSWRRDRELFGRVKINKGVITQFSELIRILKPKIDRLLEQYPGASLATCGHSLGGALAGAFALYCIKRDMPIRQVYSYGQPKFTDIQASEKLERYSQREGFHFARLSRDGDPVTKMPWTRSHNDVGTRVGIDKNNYLEDSQGWYSRIVQRWKAMTGDWKELRYFERQNLGVIGAHRMVNYIAALRVIEFVTQEVMAVEHST